MVTTANEAVEKPSILTLQFNCINSALKNASLREYQVYYPLPVLFEATLRTISFLIKLHKGLFYSLNVQITGQFKLGYFCVNMRAQRTHTKIAQLKLLHVDLPCYAFLPILVQYYCT